MSFQHFHITSKSSAWFPTNLPGCILWLDAGQGITKDGSNYISLFGDQSGQANNASQATGTNQPLWVDNQLNGKPIVRFDGSNDFMEFASGFMYNWPDLSFFIVFKPILSLNSGIFAPSNIYGTGIEFLSKSEIAEPIQLRINNNIKITSGLFSDGTFTVSDFTYNSAAANGYNNGVALTMAPGGGSLNFNGVYALGRIYATGFNAETYIAEIIAYDKTVSSEELAQIRQYLLSEYDIPVITESTYFNNEVQYRGIYAIVPSTTRGWIANAATGWWQVYHAIAKTYLTYTIKSSAVAENIPKDWTLLGSVDGVGYTLIDTVVNQTGWSTDEVRTFTIDNPGSYKYYKLVITDINGGAAIEVKQIGFSE